ncbi:MAG: NTPase [Candidatus Nezhaarchaeota archaeon]|nr:NTPase [Candidatus Nezhaarchaeota archaeon]
MWALQSKIFVTGRPGIGKTTLTMGVVDQLRRRGFRVGGMVTLELREGGVRRGFKIVDVGSGSEAPLASLSSAPGPRVGKYLVHVKNLDLVAVRAIETSLRQDELVVIDEIGPMELKSQRFVNIVEESLSSRKPILATLHYRLRHPIIDFIRSRFEVVTIDESNRGLLLSVISERIAACLTRLRVGDSGPTWS